MSTVAQKLTDRFAIGNIFIVPNGGLQPTSPTPFELKTVQDVIIDWKGKAVELRGQYLVAVDARMADVSITGKFTVGTANLNQLNNLLFAGTLTTSATTTDRINPDEAATVPATPFQVTVTHSATFSEDLGVSMQGSSAQFVKVASAPAQGQYSVAAGVYTFAAADTGALVFISYVDTGGAGAALSIPNNLQGQTPQFELVAWIPGNTDLTAGYTGYRFTACRATSMKLLEAKNNDFAKWEVDFAVFCPVNQTVGELIQSVV